MTCSTSMDRVGVDPSGPPPTACHDIVTSANSVEENPPHIPYDPLQIPSMELTNIGNSPLQTPIKYNWYLHVPEQ
ncbi:unnamed protein product [Allacma fusca]|uniref:Uncharacterized protein n=1 Tax=Allacma fusca TaxID=39272 RepID=A0A8J2L246_9HEXA|nr:unnamed protein product [Allacma fusca]